MINRKKWVLLGFIVILASAVVVTNISHKKVKTCKTTKVEKGQNTNDILIDAVADWIYSNSYRTDRYVSKWIAKCVVENAKYDISLTLAMLARESNFNITAISKADAYGIAQIHKVHFKELKKEGIINTPRDLFNPCVAVKAFNYVFEQKLRKANGNTKLAIMYYLGVNKNSKVGKKYLNDIMKYRRDFESVFTKYVFNSRLGGSNESITN